MATGTTGMTEARETVTTEEDSTETAVEAGTEETTETVVVEIEAATEEEETDEMIEAKEDQGMIEVLTEEIVVLIIGEGMTMVEAGETRTETRQGIMLQWMLGVLSLESKSKIEEDGAILDISSKKAMMLDREMMTLSRSSKNTIR